MIDLKAQVQQKDIPAVHHYLQLLRPKQWIKNVFVFAILFFSREFFNLNHLLLNIVLFICFCCISSSVYVLNDLSDIERDCNHPKKKYRPLASGAISKTKALCVLFFLLIAAFVLASILKTSVLIVIGVYFLMNIAYSFWLKHYVLVDCFIIALGFMLRLISGSVLFDIQPSSWIILCTFLLSLFLALNKRRNELVSVDQQSGVTRINLVQYSAPLIDNLLTTVSSATFISYCIYTLSASKHEYAVLTTIPVLYGLFRYQYLVVMKNDGGSVEETLLKDKALLFAITVWILMNLGMLYYGADS